MPDPVRLCQTLLHPASGHSLSLSLSLPRRLGPIKARLMCLLSLADAVHPEGTPWILPRLDLSSRPLPLLPSIFPSIRVFSNKSALCIWWPKYWSFSFNISPSNEHPGRGSPLGWTGWIYLQSKGLKESSPTPQFKSINSSVLSFLHSPTLTSIHDHWKNHSLDYIDFCWQSNVSAF